MEFTGERVVPGQVEPDLWHEHRARYRFARRLGRFASILDIGCGTGYGTAELTGAGNRAVGIDQSYEAVAFARQNYGSSDISFIQASAQSLPFVAGTFELAVAFEVIEHVSDWNGLLVEVSRVLHPDGLFVVSTPNREYYAATRAQAGPNPFHAHEFDGAEFRAALSEHFHNCAFYVQNHVGAILFQPPNDDAVPDLEVERPHDTADQPHFFIAICTHRAPRPAPGLLYVPESGNVLHARERHIAVLSEEVQKKTRWLDEAKAEHQALLRLYDQQSADLRARTEWARDLEGQLRGAAERMQALEEEVVRTRTALEQAQASANQTVAEYEQRLQHVDRELIERTLFCQQREAELEQQLKAVAEDAARSNEELHRCVALLNEAEARVAERTAFAMDQSQAREKLETMIRLTRGSKWLRLGRALGLGPKL